MKTRISLKAILFNVILSFAVMALTLSPVAGLGVFAIGTGVQLLTGQNLFNGALAMGLQTEVWVADIQEQLYYGNEFLMLAQDHSQYISNKTVHIPQAGAAPAIVKNRAAVYTEAVQRTDTERTYDLDNYTTDPILVKDVEDLQVSYSKRQSVLGSHIAALSDAIATETLQKWACTGSTDYVLRTSGADTGTLPHSTATGKRLKLTKEDVARMASRMDLDKIPSQRRFLEIPVCMFYDLFTDSDLVRSRAVINADMLAKGVITELFGFNILKRGVVVRYTSASTPVLRAASAANAVTDCAGAIAWSEFFVTQALGDIKVYINEGEAKSYGDVMSAEVNHGADNMRDNHIGRVSIAQGYVAP